MPSSFSLSLSSESSNDSGNAVQIPHLGERYDGGRKRRGCGHLRLTSKGYLGTEHGTDIVSQEFWAMSIFSGLPGR